MYQPREPINLCYDTFGAPAAMMRGLFEYLYRADGLTLVPHIPPGDHAAGAALPRPLRPQAAVPGHDGNGPVTSVLVNGEPWRAFDAKSVSLPYDQTPDEAVIRIGLGGAVPAPFVPRRSAAEPEPSLRLGDQALEPALFPAKSNRDVPALDARVERLLRFFRRLGAAGLAGRYEAAHARLAVDFRTELCRRFRLLAEGKLPRLPERSQHAADRLYLDTLGKLCEGLEKTVAAYEGASDAGRKRIHEAWTASAT